MSKHTPGPWQHGYSDGSGKTTVTNGKSTIAETNPGCGCCQGEETEEDIANARLIAAAPEMYSALKEVFTMLEDVRTGKIERGQNLYLADAQAVIVEAIQKAVGQ